MRFKELLNESVQVGQVYVTIKNMPAKYVEHPGMMTHIAMGMKIRVKDIVDGKVLHVWITNGHEDPDVCETPLEDFEANTITKREYDRQFLNGLKEAEKKERPVGGRRV